MATYDVDVVVTDPILQDVQVRVIETSSAGMPAGGLANQTLTKVSGADYDVDWEYVTGVPNGGANRYVLTKNSATDGDASWKTPGGFTFVQDTTPTAVKVGDTFFDISTGATGGNAYVAIDNGSGGLIWVQFAPGSALPQSTVGVKGRAVKTASQGGFSSTPVDVSDLAMSRDVFAGRWYSLELINVGIYATVSNDLVGLFLFADGVQVGQANFQVLGSAGQVNAAPTVKGLFQITSGNKLFKVQMNRQAGTGTMAMYSAVGWQPTLILRDEGPV